MDLEKMRKESVRGFVLSKFKRLAVPSIVWYVVHQLLTLHMPSLSVLNTYWYLNALFVCLCVIMLCAKLFKSNALCVIVSTGLVLLVPGSDISHINFMMPFLWAGYAVRRVLVSRHARPFAILCAVVGIALLPLWSPGSTVYVTPFDIGRLSLPMAKICAYRFIIGVALSSAVIYALMKTREAWANYFVPLGRCSLVIYTLSLALLGVFSKAFCCVGLQTDTYGFIDVLALALCLFIVFLTLRFCDFCRKRPLLAKLFLGEYTLV